MKLRIPEKLRAPSLVEIDEKEREKNHFAKGLNFYKLFWIFIIGCFLGVVVEFVFCLATTGHLENRTGLVYGPFNLVYGLGAVAMTLGLYWLRRCRDFVILIGGVVIGSIVEYCCSLFQELMFGTISWDYSYLKFNLNGRINLLYSFFWGVLAILWVKDFYPRMAALVLKIPNKCGKIITWVLVVFMAVNIVVSGIAVSRWEKRLSGEAPKTQIERFFDERFPNERMEWTYPNMRFLEKDTQKNGQE